MIAPGFGVEPTTFLSVARGVSLARGQAAAEVLVQALTSLVPSARTLVALAATTWLEPARVLGPVEESLQPLASRGLRPLPAHLEHLAPQRDAAQRDRALLAMGDNGCVILHVSPLQPGAGAASVLGGPPGESRLVAVHRLSGPTGWFCLIALGRDADEAPFNSYDAERLRVINREVVPILLDRLREGGGTVLTLQGAAVGRLARLSPAQRRVLELLVGGLTEAEIGKRLFRSPHTIHDHVRAIYRQLEVHSRLQLLRVYGLTFAAPAPETAPPAHVNNVLPGRL